MIVEERRQGPGFRVSHRAWGEFPETLCGRALAWVSIALLDMKADAERHACVELEYFRRRLEACPDA